LISLSSVADGGDGRGEEAPLKNPLSPRFAGGAREWLLRGRTILFTKQAGLTKPTALPYSYEGKQPDSAKIR